MYLSVQGSSVRLVKTRRFEDERGWFAETYSVRNFGRLGINAEFVQDNQSLSRPTGTVRGLHFQAPPHAQAKLVRCVKGSILDVALDVRKGSPTYGQWVSAELSAQNGHQLFVPVGYAHGFITLQPDTEVIYKVSDFYHAASEGGVLWNDPEIGIVWPMPMGGPVLSPKDLDLPVLAELNSPFSFDGLPLMPLEA